MIDQRFFSKAGQSLEPFGRFLCLKIAMVRAKGARARRFLVLNAAVLIEHRNITIILLEIAKCEILSYTYECAICNNTREYEYNRTIGNSALYLAQRSIEQHLRGQSSTFEDSAMFSLKRSTSPKGWAGRSSLTSESQGGGSASLTKFWWVSPALPAASRR